MKARDKRNLRTGLLFVSPWIVGFTAFVLIPAGLSLYFSFCDYSVLSPPIFIGVGNYFDLATDPIFRKAVWNTLVFGVIALPLTTVLSIGLSLLVHAAAAGRTVFRTLFFLPSLVPFVALAVLWSWMLNGQYGIVNYMLEILFDIGGLDDFGIARGPNWLRDPNVSKMALVIVVLWGIGQPMVIYLAGLVDIPRSYYEVAIMDGANWWSQTWHVTIPLLSPVIYFNIIMGCISILQVFAIPFVMMGAQGEPLRSTLFYLMYIFDQGFRKMNMGYACAMAWLLFVFIALLTYGAHRMTVKHVHYDVT